MSAATTPVRCYQYLLSVSGSLRHTCACHWMRPLQAWVTQAAA